jgi:hypothetical protein
MTKQTINVGTTANTGTGDTLRQGAGKINANFTEIYTKLGNGTDMQFAVDLAVAPTQGQTLQYNASAGKFIAGTAGSSGAQGPAGPQGPQGIPGATGPQGPTGPQGATGATGPQGAVGAEGPAGASGSGTGDVNSVGGGYVDNRVVRYNGTSGTSIQNSLVSISDVGAIVAPEAGSIIPFYFANQAAFPSAVTYHGAIAHSHADGKMYFAHGGVWIELANASDVSAAANSFTTLAVSGQSSVVADSATDTLTLAAGTGISITTNAGTDTVTITSTVSAGATAYTGLSDAAGNTTDKFYLPALTMLNVTNNGLSSYRFHQYGTADNPTIYALNGATIAFNLNVAGHPFLIQTSGGANYNEGLIHVTTAGVVTTGSSAQGKTSGTLYWQIPTAISGNYRYICSIHGAMVGVITIKDFSVI